MKRGESGTVRCSRASAWMRGLGFVLPQDLRAEIGQGEGRGWRLAAPGGFAGFILPSYQIGPYQRPNHAGIQLRRGAAGAAAEISQKHQLRPGQLHSETSLFYRCRCGSRQAPGGYALPRPPPPGQEMSGMGSIYPLRTQVIVAA